MNFLAHCYLSGDSDELLLGNFIADGLKGTSFPMYSSETVKGILLHRLIDDFTDTHAEVRKSKARLSSKYGRYGAVIVDIFYDHFLAKDWNKYSPIPLETYTGKVYRILNDHSSQLPERVGKFLPYMVAQNWLGNYGSLHGIQQTLQGMSRRAKFHSRMEESIEDLKKDYDLYNDEFDIFFQELIVYAAAQRQLL